MPKPLRRILARVMAPLRHDPAWFELASIMGAVGWAILGLCSTYQFDDWPSMRFISAYVGDAPLWAALTLGVAQGVAVFGMTPVPARSMRWRKCCAFLMGWGWLFLGLGIARTLPGLNPHVALYVVMAMLNWMVTFRLSLPPQARPIDG